MTGREHERLLIVHGRAFEDRGRRGAPVLERRHAAPRGRADPAAELPVDQPPRVQRERHRRATGRARRPFAQRSRQARDVAEEQEHRRLARTVDLDAAAPAPRPLGRACECWSPARPVLAPGAIAACEQSAPGGVAQPQAAALGVELVDQPCGVVVEWHQRAGDRRQVAGSGVLEQRRHRLRCRVGGEPEPPVLIRSREVQEALVAAAPRAAAPHRRRQRVAHVRLARQVPEQARERLGALGVERHAPGSPLWIPAPARDRAQKLAQALVVGKPQHGLAGEQ